METTTKHSIVLLDDDRFLLDMYAIKFTQAGYKVLSCLSVDEVLGALRGGLTPDAIVFDLTMPGKDGFDLLRALQEEKLGKGATLVALTNQSADEERAKTEALGAHEYIIKATTIPSEVVNTITTVLSAHRKA